MGCCVIMLAGVVAFCEARAVQCGVVVPVRRSLGEEKWIAGWCDMHDLM